MQEVSASTKLTMMIYFVLLAKLHLALACVGGGGFGNNENRVITNPTFSWTMYPPVDWTYPGMDAVTKDAVLLGQSITQSDATNRANGDMEAAALQALSAANIPSSGVKIVPTYSPPQISNCQSVTPGIPIGGVFGIVEQGAVTQKATAVVAITDAICISRAFAANSLTYAPFDVQKASIQIEGISASEFQMEQVAAKMQNTLNFNDRVRFVTPVEVNS